MKPISCIAIDDEPMALLIIEQFCNRKGNITLSTFSEPSSGIQAILQTNPDLIFLDIEMNSISGLEIANKLPQNCCFIFTTAHAKYALEGFNLDAVDFLHKPFSYERFGTAVDKAIRRLESKHPHISDTLVVKQEYCNVKIPMNDITYIEALGNYVKIFRENGRHVISHTTMKSILSQLPEKTFLRIHRSFIISLGKVERFSRNGVKLSSILRPIPIGKKYSEKVFDKLNESV